MFANGAGRGPLGERMAERIQPELSAKMANMSIVSAFLIVAMHGYSMMSIPAFGTMPWWFYKLFKESFTDIAVPYFFCASAFFFAGHLAEHGWFKKAILKRVKTIVVPYVLWVLVSIPIKLFGLVVQNKLTGKYIWEGCDFSVRRFVSGLGLTLDSPDPTILWFLRSLFVFMLISPILFYALKRWGVCVLVLLFACNYLLMPLGYLNRIIQYVGSISLLSMNGLTYFALGAWMRLKPQMGWKDFCGGGKYIWPVLMIMIVVRILLLRKGFSYQGLIDKSVIPVALLAAWCVIPVHPLPYWLTSASFPVYLIHPFIYYFVYGLTTALHCNRLMVNNLCLYLLMVLSVFTASVLVMLMMRRYLPVASRLLFGGRQ